MKYLIFAILLVSSLSYSQDCGPSRLIDNGGETAWIDYNSDLPADPNSVWEECEHRVFVTTNSEIIYIDYPYQAGIVTLEREIVIDDTTLVSETIEILPWHITPQIAQDFNYTGPIPDVADIYVHSNPSGSDPCPTKNFYEIRYRKNADNQLQYMWRYTESEYYTIPDPFDSLINSSNVTCLDFGNGDIYTPNSDTKYTRIYDGSCDSRVDTNGDKLIVSGEVVSYGGGNLDGNEFSPNEDNWELIFTGSLTKDGGQFADFVVEQIK